MEMENGERVIGKVEKGFELATMARNLHLRLKGETFQIQPAHSIFKSIIHDSYYNGRQHDILTLTKPESERDFDFLILATAEVSNVILESKLTYNDKKL